ncbi:Possible regulatory protein, partial [hydrothermal vent metagenome]
MNIDFLKIDTNDIKMNLVNLKQLVFEVTDACNLNCKYCGYGEFYEGYDPRKREGLSFKKAQNIIEYLAKLWKDNIETSLSQPFTLSFYGGEPLISMELIKEIIRFTESLDITCKKIHYSMTTNGMLLKKHMDFLAAKQFNLLVSLDGNEKNHSYRVDHRGNNSHKQVIDNIKLLQQ